MFGFIDKNSVDKIPFIVDEVTTLKDALNKHEIVDFDRYEELKNKLEEDDNVFGKLISEIHSIDLFTTRLNERLDEVESKYRELKIILSILFPICGLLTGVVLYLLFV